MYNNMAYVYDRLMYDVDYKKWADYIEKILKKYKEPHLLLDLGCGTGSFAVEMAGRGYEMIGIDISDDMLSCAKNKALSNGADILFLNQDMCDFELYGTVDAVTCLMDGVNHITCKKKLWRMLWLVKNYLNPGGVFVFDINTRYKIEKVLGNNLFYDMSDEVSYIWANSYDEKRRVGEFDLTFFIKENELYKRFEETQYEKAYDIKELEFMLKLAGFKILGIYDELSFKPFKNESQRVFFECVKV